MRFRLSVVAGLLATFAFTARATAGPVEIYYAPVENLELVDVALLKSAALENRLDGLFPD